MWRIYLFSVALGAASLIIVDYVKERALKRRRKLARQQRRWRRTIIFYRPLTSLTHGYVNLLFLPYLSLLEQFFREVDPELEDNFSPETRVLMRYLPWIKYTRPKAWSVGSGTDNPKLRCTSAQAPFPFLDLPAEIRCMIYDFLLRLNPEGLGISEIYIEDSVGRLCLPSMMLGASNKVSNYYISRTRFSSNRTPEASEITLGTFSYKESERTHLPAFLHAQADIVHVGILRTNRLIYEEAVPALYRQHISFDCAAEGTLAFMKDAPQWALKYITSIQFCHVDGTDVRHWSELCRFVQTRLQLKTLRFDLDMVTIILFMLPPLSRPITQLDMGSLDPDKADDCLREQWDQDLSQIQGLDTLFIGFSNDKGILQSLKADFAWLLMSKMVVGGAGLDREKLKEHWLSNKARYVWVHNERSIDSLRQE